MSKRQSRSQASSSRAASAGSSMGFGAPFGSGSVAGRSSLSYFTKPPDFTSISDPNVIVAFKNLMKKDPTTKARALEDLRAYARTHPQREDQPAMEEAVLEAWVRPLCLWTLSCKLPHSNILDRSNYILAPLSKTPDEFASSHTTCSLNL